MVSIRLAASRRLEGVNKVLNILHRMSIGNHDGIRRFNHNQVFNTGCRHQARLATDVAIAGIVDDHIALDYIT